MSKTYPVYTLALKLLAVRRMLAGENVSGLARELGVRRKRLYAWRDGFRESGPEGLRPRGPPTESDAASAANG